MKTKKRKNKNGKIPKVLNFLFSLILKILKRRIFLGPLFLFLAFFFLFSFFEKGGKLGKLISLPFQILFGSFSLLFFSFIFFFTSLFILFRPKKPKILFLLSLFLLIFGIFGFYGEGKIGKFFSFFLFQFFGPIFSKLIFIFSVFLGCLIIFFLFLEKKPEPSLFIRKIIFPKFQAIDLEPPEPKVKRIEIQVEKEKEKEKPIPQIEYQPPPLNFLEEEKGKPSPGDLKQNFLIIKKTLNNFGIEIEMGEVNVGPTVTQYTLRPAEGIKLSKITSLGNDLALALAAHPIRIEAPIPGKSLVGIEVPNKVRTLVRLRNLISLPEFKNSSPLTFVLGRDVSGEPVFSDLSKMPHLLVAGATGTGKTIFLNSLILSLVYRNSPQILKFVLIDPKRVEFPVYQSLPHLFSPVIFDPEKVVRVLDWLVFEMERRFEILARKKVRDIFEFNQLAGEEKSDFMPYIVLIIDELADIMAVKGREVENRIVRLAQLARAVGIHLVLATQRPSVEVLTGLIKANITSRIAFQVASQFDSRTILDTAGAEKLLGRGDMLFLSAENVKPKRIQGAFVSANEIKKVVNWFEEKGMKPSFDLSLLEALEREKEGVREDEFFSKDDPLYEEAKKIVIAARKASASLLQRKLKIGYARAARLLDILEERGVIGPAQGSKPREVLIEKEDEWKSV